MTVPEIPDVPSKNVKNEPNFIIKGINSPSETPSLGNAVNSNINNVTPEASSPPEGLL